MRLVAGVLVIAACSFAPPKGAPGSDASVGDDAPGDAAAAGCPMGYDPLPGAPSRYRIPVERGTWLAAEADCRDDGAGTHLAIPETEAEHDAFVDALSNASKWLGVTDRITEGQWLPIIGGTAGWIPHWYGDGPFRGELGNCLLLARNVFEEDTPCMGEGTPPNEQWDKGYICECDGKAVDLATF